MALVVRSSPKRELPEVALSDDSVFPDDEDPVASAWVFVAEFAACEVEEGGSTVEDVEGVAVGIVGPVAPGVEDGVLPLPGAVVADTEDPGSAGLLCVGLLCDVEPGTS